MTFKFVLEYDSLDDDELVEKTQKLSLEPSNETASIKKYCGLINMSQTCYWNTILQFMFHTEEIGDVLLQRDATTNARLTDTVIDVFKKLESSQRAFQPKAFFKAFQLFNEKRYGEKIECHQPQDVHEYLFRLLNHLCVDLNYLFKGRHRSVRYENDVEGGCQNIEFGCIDLVVYGFNKCEYILAMSNENVISYFVVISLVFICIFTVEDALMTHFGPTSVGNGVMKYFPIIEVPSILFLKLNIFFWKNGESMKTNDRFEFPAKLYISNDYFSSMYDLQSVFVHDGTSMNGGHYYLYQKINEEWHEFNDAKVTRSDEKKAIDGNFGGGEHYINAYMLAYKRKSM